jgi:hypothetical protein
VRIFLFQTIEWSAFFPPEDYMMKMVTFDPFTGFPHSDKEPDGGPLVRSIRLAISFFQAYITMTLVCVGIFGNVLSMVIFTINKKRDMVSAQYLRVLAVSDSGMLILVGLRNFIAKGVSYAFGNDVGFDVLVEFTAACKIFRYLEQVCMFLSAFLIVLFSVERVFAVWMPLRMVSMFTTRRRYTSIATLIIMTALMKSHVLVYFDTYATNSYSNCWYALEMPEILKVGLVMYDLVPNQVMPCFLIFVLNIVICAGIKRSSGQVKVEDDEQLRRRRRDTRCIVNLLVVSTVFFIFTTPQSILWFYTDIATFILAKHDPGITEQHLGTMYEISRFSDSLGMFNYCLNFIIYGVSLNYYRESVIDIFCCRKGHLTSLNRQTTGQ